jgi:outer membrane receptor protein involved in Fe transport
VSLGYGLHSQEQSIYAYFVQTPTPAGVTFTNKDLGFTQSQHIVASYDLNISQNMRVKLECYYQALSNVPVNSYPSSYAAINEGFSFGPPNEDSLVNGGTARNYGAEITIEHFLDHGFYFLITGSLINSTYKGSDGIERNTAFNTGYVANILAGKEYSLRGNRKLGVNIKLSEIGGRYLTPIDLASSIAQGQEEYAKSLAYSVKQPDYFRTDIKLSYKKEYKRSTMEFSMDLENITNHKNIFDQTYDKNKHKIVDNYQQGFFPVPTFRMTF